MNTLQTSQLVFGPVAEREYPEFLAVVDRAFGRGPEATLRQDLPTALGKNNRDHLYAGRSQNEIVCAAAALVRPWKTSVGEVAVACVGSFATRPDCRGRGFSRGLQNWMLVGLAAEGVGWAMLWTDRPEIYAARGFRPGGYEEHGDLSTAPWPALPPEFGLRDARPGDAPALLRLYQTHVLRARRDVGDQERVLTPGVSSVAVAVDAHDVPTAYAALGKGQDFPGYIHEYAGPVDVVHALWGHLHGRGAGFVLLPQGAESFCRGAAAAMVRRGQAAAYVRRLNPGAPDPGAVAWAVWGFDSA